jgi:hypothetical protein
VIVDVRPDSSAWFEGLTMTKANTVRPLGSDGLMVDENSMIWRGEQPVGVWDVNGGEAAGLAELPVANSSTLGCSKTVAKPTVLVSRRRV